MTAIAAGPDWASVMTAFGTVAVAIAAVGIALWSERRTDRRLADERALSDKRLADERAHSDARLRDERQHAQEQEQLTEAYSVQVVMGDMPAGPKDDVYEQHDDSAKCLTAVVVNHGKYTITKVEARFRLSDGNELSRCLSKRISGWSDLPDELTSGLSPSASHGFPGVTLTPWDAGLRFESDPIGVQHLGSEHPVVRWTDQWGTRWEHRRGEVRQVEDSSIWPAW